jgi:osmotically-inducible protein OsmY
MIKPTPFIALGAILTVAGALAGCATFGKCDAADCRDDKAITTNVQAQLNQYAALGAPYSIGVQTIDHVVYLNGQVDGGLAKRSAAQEAEEVPGVAQVVNNIDVVHK